MRRCRAAAAAEAVHAQVRNLAHQVGELVRVNVEHGHTVFAARQTGVRVDDDRERAYLGQALHDRLHLLRAEAAVDAERVYAQTLKHGNDRVHRAAGQQLAFFVEDGGDDNRQVAALLRRENGRLRLVAVAHGFNQHEVRACGRADADGFGEQLYRPLERQVAHRLEQLARRTDVERYIGILAAGESACGFRVADRRFHDFAQVIRVFERVRAEGVRVDDVASGLVIAAVERDNLVRVRKVPRFGQLTRFQAVRLKNRTHAAVKKQPFFS